MIVDTDVSFMGFKLGFSDEFSNPTAKMPPHFGGSACQLRQAFDNITQSIDVIDICPINLIASG